MARTSDRPSSSSAPFDQRHSHEEYDAVVAQKIRELCNREIDEAIVSVFRAPPIQGLGNGGGFQLQVEQLASVDLDALQKGTDELTREANASSELDWRF